MTTHVHKVVGSNHSDIYWMDTWTFFHIVIDKNCIVCLKRPKINEKRPELAHFLLKKVLHSSNVDTKWPSVTGLANFCQFGKIVYQF